MKRSLTITRSPIDEAALIRERSMPTTLGAAVYFSGVVREMENEDKLTAIDYEAFPQMAEHQFQLIFDEVEKAWPVDSIRLIHRIGPVRVNESSLWLEVLSGHRGEAFAACEYIIDEMKKRVPIWKRPISESQG